MAATALFMIVYGIQLCLVTRFSDDGRVSRGCPWPSSTCRFRSRGLFTLLFLIERVWVGSPPKTSIMYRDQATELE